MSAQPGEIHITILMKPELSEYHVTANYGDTPDEVRNKLAEKLGISPSRIRLFIKRPDGAEYEITHSSESVGQIVSVHGNVWYASIEEPYGSLIDAIEAFREHYLSSGELQKKYSPLANDPGLGIWTEKSCKRKEYCSPSRPYRVFVFPSVGYPVTQPLIFVSPKVLHKCCFYNLKSQFFDIKAKELPELAPAFEEASKLVNVNMCVMHIESWDYLRKVERNPLEVLDRALCTDVGLCDGTGA
ncbi:hypothetical protein [Ignicoccus hospitalis]|uniref:Ubiquitin-like domain-containing protein n=1 Tax=Ignicoccus hospitalis (strain KIN4/I / DSM 18386 / JCM 14125) TaxID=453591 RepID=A8A8R8_IGNH4|nr:hypothetical protein [Ignicoccus hospitalis]ABU81320.1 hypothetical protein Igni_0136 [Ignicoccus hospitalis KIN4/I]HIH90376.1 hypothetical protein [Desulfurococcaceae archaeon]